MKEIIGGVAMKTTALIFLKKSRREDVKMMIYSYIKKLLIDGYWRKGSVI